MGHVSGLLLLRLSVSPPHLWCLCKSTKIYAVVTFLIHFSLTAARSSCKFVHTCNDACHSLKAMRCHWGKKDSSLKTSWVIWRLLDMLYSRLKFQTKHICRSPAMPCKVLTCCGCCTRNLWGHIYAQSHQWYTQLTKPFSCTELRRKRVNTSLFKRAVQQPNTLRAPGL